MVASLFSSSALCDVRVRGYHRKDGTYVQPHYRSDPDGDRSNNWSTRGNVNPYTGERGTKSPYDNNMHSYGGRNSSLNGGGDNSLNGYGSNNIRW